MAQLQKFFLWICTLLLLNSPVAALPGENGEGEFLSSWNDGPTKQRIIDFVVEVTDPSSPHFVDPQNRIATFDNDGTLWCEKPIYTHLFAVFDRCKELVARNPDLKELEPFKAVVNKDLSYFEALYEDHSFNTLLGQLMAVPFAGTTLDSFHSWNRKWLDSWKHPKFGVGYKQLIYQPMVELVHYLKANDFQVYIFTADEGAFLRLVSEELYGIPPEHVQGSSVRLEYIAKEGHSALFRTYQANYFNNWSAKPRLIQQVIGKRPIFAAGNSNGDFEMLQYVGSQENALALLVHHTDGEREYQYDKHTDKVLPAAQKDGWVIVDMKDVWKKIFPG